MKPLRLATVLAPVLAPVFAALLLSTLTSAGPALADDLSANLAGGGQGVASIRTLNASNLDFSLFANVGNVTSAEILQGGSVFLSLGGGFGSSFAAGSASGNVAAIDANPGAFSVRVLGTGGTVTGGLVFAAESGGGGPGPSDGRIDTGNTAPCGQNGAGCALDNQYDVTGFLVNLDGVEVQATFQSATSDTVFAFVFDDANIEFLVKVLETCAINGKRWIFAGGATDRPGQIAVREVSTGLARVYDFGAGPFVAINDTQNGQACPTP